MMQARRYDHPADIKLENGKIVHQTRMYDGRIIASVWEPSNHLGAKFAQHGTITTRSTEPEQVNLIGRIGTRDIPERIDRMRAGSDERIAACIKWRADQAAEVRELLAQAGLRGKFDIAMCEMEVEVSE
jgi:hypothetical protein